MTNGPNRAPIQQQKLRLAKMAPSSEIAATGIVAPQEIAIDKLLSAAIARVSDSPIDLVALLENVDVVEGRAKVDKASMIGVPHVITSVSFRKGTKTPDGIQHDYISCEFTTVTAAPVEAVYNDGSTGIRRQVVGYLAGKGVLAEAYKENPDIPVWVQPADEAEKDPEFSIRFLAPRGLRVSDYENEYTKDGKTFYLA